jgi:hypothetical protein
VNHRRVVRCRPLTGSHTPCTHFQTRHNIGKHTNTHAHTFTRTQCRSPTRTRTPGDDSSTSHAHTDAQKWRRMRDQPIELVGWLCHGDPPTVDWCGKGPAASEIGMRKHKSNTPLHSQTILCGPERERERERDTVTDPLLGILCYGSCLPKHTPRHALEVGKCKLLL